MPENDTATPQMSGPEIENRRLVFDLSDCKGLMLDKGQTMIPSGR